MIQIIPSILTNDPEEAREMITRCDGVVGRVSVDIIDGKFAANKTIDPIVLQSIDTSLKLDFQLMVVEPINWVERCISAGADRIIGHIEQMGDQTEFVGKVQEVGALIGLALDLPTSVSDLDATILNNLDVVLVMSVPAGFGGQKFDPSVLSKIKELDKIRARDKTPFKIQVDGGIMADNIKSVFESGADEVSVGRGLFKGDLAENLERLLKETNDS
jgi:ribulose-phosphate 3-epimerase